MALKQEHQTLRVAKRLNLYTVQLGDKLQVQAASNYLILSFKNGAHVDSYSSSDCSPALKHWAAEGVTEATVVSASELEVVLEATKQKLSFPELKPVWEGWITGLSHHQYREVKSCIRTGYHVTVSPISDNLYDPEAIAVSVLGKQIGWIPKNDKGILPILLAAAAKDCGIVVQAVVLEHNEMHAGDTHYQACVYIQVLSNYWDWKEAQKYKQQQLQQPQQQTKPVTIVKETKMAKLAQVIATNKSAVTTAAQLEAGRIANKYASKLISGKLPMMVRGYADTPVARLLLANTVSFVASNYSEKLGDKSAIVQSVADAMVVSAYSEMLAHFDIDSFIEEFFSSKEMKRVGALLKTDSDEETEAPVSRRRRNTSQEGDK